ncbi:hypothetical protein AB0M35_18155 [Micromonospora sp. NPDC051196]|uniref:hypothetical protein n=1 Tax=Micromonospora sp. NPDC051196 TaxID=3155281 RepID=UPI00343AB003
MSTYDRTPPGTTVRLVIPEAMIVAHGDLQMRVTLPDHPGDIVTLPLVDERFRPVVEIHPHLPTLHPGQTWRGAGGTLLHAVQERRDAADAGETLLVSVVDGMHYTRDLAIDTFGPLTLLGELAPHDETWLPPAPVAPVSPAAPAIGDTAILPRVPAEEAHR